MLSDAVAVSTTYAKTGDVTVAETESDAVDVSVTVLVIGAGPVAISAK
jgi:threonine dehydrogenase-like Zn-dependent dehydrogenase